MKNFEKAIEVTRSSVRIYDEIGGPQADKARKQLDQLLTHKSGEKPQVIFIPIGLIFAIVAIVFSYMNGGKSSSSAIRTSTALAEIMSWQPPTTGTITGMILDKNQEPLVNTLKGMTGIVALFCPGNDLDVECLHKNYSNMGISDLISSICDANTTANNCILHWGRSAARLEANGSYTIHNVPPGQYELVLIIVDSGVSLTIQLKNVKPVHAGEVTRFNFVTK